MNIFCEERIAGRAQIRITAPSASAINGTIRGPFCRYATTLPSTFPVRDGKCVIVDPCYWTPNLPFQYVVEVDVADEQGGLKPVKLDWGIRWCLPHRSDLRLNGKRFVFRAITMPEADVDLPALRELHCGLIVQEPSVEFVTAASEQGVMLFDRAAVSPAENASRNGYAALHFVGPGTEGARCDTLSVGAEDSHAIRMVDFQQLGKEPVGEDRPTFICRAYDGGGLAEMRKACDELQRDAAAFGQFAGYLIVGNA